MKNIHRYIIIAYVIIFGAGILLSKVWFTVPVVSVGLIFSHRRVLCVALDNDDGWGSLGKRLML